MLGIGSGASKSGKVRGIVKDGLQAWYKCDTTQAPLGEEEVANGGFDIGSEIVVNGSFGSSANWSTHGSGVSFSNGEAVIPINSENDNVGIYQENVFTNAITYKIIIKAKGSANFTANLLETQGATSQQAISNIALTTSYQEFTIYHTAQGTNDIFIQRLAGHEAGKSQTIFVDNISIRQTNPNSSWDLGTGWSVSDGSASCDGSQSGNSNLKQLVAISDITEDKKYTLTYTISGYSGSGNINPHFKGTATGNVTGNGTRTVTGIAGNSTDYSIAFQADSTFVGTVSDVSVKEITNSVRDYSSNTNNAVLYSGKALEFDDSDDTIALGSNAQLSDVWTIAFWANPDAHTNGSDFHGVIRWGDTIVSFSSDTNLRVWADPGTAMDHTISSATGVWKRYVIVQGSTTVEPTGTGSFNGTGLCSRVYINGELVSSLTSVTTDHDAQDSFIGSRLVNTDYFDGKLADVQVYDKDWSTADVEYDWNNPDKDVFDGGGNGKILGSNLMNNGTFDTNTDIKPLSGVSTSDGWIGWNMRHNNTKMWQENGKGVQENTGDGTDASATFDVDVTAGKTYEISVTGYVTGSIESSTYISNGANFGYGGGANSQTDQNVWGGNVVHAWTGYYSSTTKTFTVTPLEDIIRIYMYSNGDGTGKAYFDNITVKEVIQPESSIKPTDCIALYRLNEGEGTRVYNSAPILSANLITNGDFSNVEDDWYVFQDGWNVVDGKATFVWPGDAAHIQQDNVLVANSNYQVTLTVSDMTKGALSVRLGTSEDDQVYRVEANGTYTVSGAAGGTSFRLRAQSVSGTFDGSVDNVSVKKITLPTSYAITGGGSWVHAQPYIPQLSMSSYSKKMIFQNIRDFIDLGSTQTIAAEAAFSVSFWYSPGSNSGNENYILSNADDNNKIYINNETEDIYIIMDGQTTIVDLSADTEAGDLTDYKLVHIVIARVAGNNGHIRTYINGHHADNHTGDDATDRAFLYRYIGLNKATDVNVTSYFLDEIAVFNKELSAGEVRELYNSGMALNARDHSAYLGSELVTDTDLNDSTYWTREDTYTAGTFVFSDNGLKIDSSKNVTGTDDGTEYIHKSSFGTTNGDVVSITYTITDYVSGQFRAYIGNTSGSTAVSGNGTYTFADTADASQVLYLQSSTDFIGTISSISVKKVDLIGYWRNNGSNRTWDDLSDYNNDGTVANTELLATVQTGKTAITTNFDSDEAGWVNTSSVADTHERVAYSTSGITAQTGTHAFHLKENGDSGRGIRTTNLLVGDEGLVPELLVYARIYPVASGCTVDGSGNTTILTGIDGTDRASTTSYGGLKADAWNTLKYKCTVTSNASSPNVNFLYFICPGTKGEYYIDNVAVYIDKKNIIFQETPYFGRDTLGLPMNHPREGGLNFDGKSDLIISDDSSLDFGTNNFTVEAWFKMGYNESDTWYNDDQNSIYNVIYSHGGNMASDTDTFSLSTTAVSGGDGVRFHINNIAVDSGALTDDKWYHVVGTRGGTAIKLYVNAHDGSTPTSQTAGSTNAAVANTVTNAHDKKIGRDHNTHRHFTNNIDSVRLYNNKAFSIGEVVKNWKKGKATHNSTATWSDDL